MAFQTCMVRIIIIILVDTMKVNWVPYIYLFVYWDPVDFQCMDKNWNIVQNIFSYVLPKKVSQVCNGMRVNKG